MVALTISISAIAGPTATRDVCMMHAPHRLPGQASILRNHRSRGSKAAHVRHPFKRLRVQRCVALEEADWEEEMSLFRKRLQKPNQLETMRKIVEEVDIGKVRDAPSSVPHCWHESCCRHEKLVNPCRCSLSGTALPSSKVSTTMPQ